MFIGFFEGYLIIGTFVNNLALEYIWRIAINILGGLIVGFFCMKLKEGIMIIFCSITGAIISVYMTMFLIGLAGNPMDI